MIYEPVILNYEISDLVMTARHSEGALGSLPKSD
jgi:hypothetical protein